MKIKKLLILAVPALIAVYGITYVSNMSSQSSKPAPAVVEEIATDELELEVAEPDPVEDGLEDVEETDQEQEMNYYDHPTRLYLRDIYADIRNTRPGMKITLVEETVQTRGAGLHSKLTDLNISAIYQVDENYGIMENGYLEFTTSEAKMAAENLLAQANIFIVDTLEAEARRRKMNCTANYCFGIGLSTSN